MSVPGTRLVVGAAIVRAGRVLAARRSAPPALAGGWEFPGGKVEDGETPQAALLRECQEELGVLVAVGQQVGETSIRPGLLLRIYLASLVAGDPQPRQDHDVLRWLTSGDLDSVPWLPADRPVLPLVAALL